MESDTIHSLEEGLTQRRENLTRWIETTPQPKKEDLCCASDDSCMDECLQVIDKSLEKIHDGTFGICEICQETVDDELLRMDYTSTICLAHYTEQELHELETELELSQVVQRGLLPQQTPDIPGMAIAAFSRPAQIVSGDYFDFVKFKDGSHGIVMADVSGHGVSAGMLMSSLQTAFHTIVPGSDSPLEVLERINHLYAHNINLTTFVTVFFGKYEPVTRTFTYGSAGHPSAYLHRAANGDEVLLHPTGPAIGLMEGFNVRSKQVQLNPGDTLVLYTDGVTEAADGRGVQLGLDGLASVIQANQDLAPERLIQKIITAVTEHTGGKPLADDVTLIIGKVE